MIKLLFNLFFYSICILYMVKIDTCKYTCWVKLLRINYLLWQEKATIQILEVNGRTPDILYYQLLLHSLLLDFLSMSFLKNQKKITASESITHTNTYRKPPKVVIKKATFYTMYSHGKCVIKAKIRIKANVERNVKCLIQHGI